MKKFIKFANILIILAFCVILFSIFIGIKPKDSIVKNGVLDLTKISNVNSPVKLNGEWEFYFGQLVSTDGKIHNTKNKEIVKVPANWSNYKDKDNKNLPSNGYGVYKISIKSTKDTNLAVKIPQIGSSYNLWIDGKIRYSSGQVGKNADESKPKWTTKVINFSVQNEYTEIMIEVANFYYFRAGITNPIIIGTQDQIQQLKYSGLFLDSFIFAALSVVAIFFLLMYLLHTHNETYIYLALFSISIALRPLLYGECFFNDIFPNINFEVNCKIYLVSFVAIQLFFLYFYSQYKDILSKKFLHIIGWPLIFIIIIGVILPSKYMIYPAVLLESMIPIVVILCIYLLYIAYRNKCEGVSVNILSVLMLSLLALVDILNNSEIINLNIYYTPIAMLIIALTQAFLQVCKSRENALLNEKLTHEIEINNLKLSYERKQRNITEKLNDELKAMISTLDIEELIISMADNLSKIVEFDNIVIVLKEKNSSLIASKIGNNTVKCTKYNGRTDIDNNKTFYNKTEFEDIKTTKLYNSNSIERVLIVKPLYYKDELFCVIKMVASSDKIEINDDFIQLINVYCEQSILAFQNAKSYKKIKELAMYDELTKVYNRRYLMKLGLNELITEQDFTVVILDIDYFKKINDTYGHLFGDKVIKSIAYLCKKCMPLNSIVGRYGGEEFLIFLKNIKLNDIFILLEKLREEVEKLNYPYKNDVKVKVTISIGFSLKQNNEEDLNSLINNADKALYEAKNAGRNCVRMYQEIDKEDFVKII